MTGRLPEGFAALEPFVDVWAVGSSAARDQLRGSSTAAERQAFYGAAQPLAPAALEYLDRKPLDRLDDTETRLMNLMLSLCHVAPAVEAHGDDEPRHAKMRAFMPITRTPADR
jgi:hypothetical protein